MQTDDGYIIQKCLDGDSAAFGLLVDKYKKSIYALAYSRIHNFHDAQDIAQEVFIKAYKDLPTLRHWDSFMGWLYRITVNLCKNWQRSESRRPDRDFAEDQDLSLLDFSTYQQDNIYDSIREALDSLPEMYHEVLVLHYFDGMSIRDISRFLGISPRTVDRRLSEARIILKEEIMTMTSAIYNMSKLPADFTFKIVEMVKRIKLHPTIPTNLKGLPYGLSIATGLIIALLSINPLIHFEQLGAPMNSPLPVEAKILKVGEIPVDIVKTSKISLISSGLGKGGIPVKPGPQNAFFMAPQGEGGTWEVKSNMLTTRICLALCAVNGKIYAIGGTATRNSAPAFSTVEEYDPALDRWTRKKDMPTARHSLVSCALDGRIYAIGGSVLDFNKFVMPAALPVVEEYNPITDEWNKSADMTSGRFMFSAAALDGRIYVAGGGDPSFNYTSTTQVYTPEVLPSSISLQGKMPKTWGSLKNR